MSNSTKTNKNQLKPWNFLFNRFLMVCKFTYKYESHKQHYQEFEPSQQNSRPSHETWKVDFKEAQLTLWMLDSIPPTPKKKQFNNTNVCVCVCVHGWNCHFDSFRLMVCNLTYKLEGMSKSLHNSSIGTLWFKQLGQTELTRFERDLHSII